MRFVACIKQVPQSQESGIDSVTLSVRREGVPWMISPADEHALEEALHLRERFGGEVQALCMGVKSAVEMLRYALSLGVDRVALVSDPMFVGSDTYVTARVLSRAIEKMGGADVILCGRRSFDGETGQTAPQLAIHQNMICVTNVIRVEANLRGSLKITRLADEGEELIEAEPPILLAVCEGINHVRLPGIGSMRRAKDVPVQVLNGEILGFRPDEVGIKGSPTRVVQVERVEFGRSVRVRIEKDARTGAENILERVFRASEG
ncbi:MAG: electron transfer flavoprotein subunit beta/FixA family protein [Synergistaceae bacterium]|jgi:electron transfer flavoprotein alpha/beta subunit|nr:electron transfer flavoprotein subunit beta/FixA family protein [Synergistaceae bacterium]